MVTGAILETGEAGYTYLKKLFCSMGHFQKNYNWLITDCESCPEKQGHSSRIVQSKEGNYAWIGGDELTNIVRKMIFNGYGQFCPDLTDRFRRRTCSDTGCLARMAIQASGMQTSLCSTRWPR